MTAPSAHSTCEIAGDTGGSGDRIDLGLVRALFAGLTYQRSAWLRFVDQQGCGLAESGERPAEDHRISSAEVRVGERHVGTIFGATNARAQDVSEGPTFTELVARTLAQILYHEMELDSLTAELLVKYEEITLLLDLSRAFRAELDAPGLCAAAVDKAVEAFDPDAVWVAVAPDGAAPLCVLAVAGSGPVAGREVARGEGCAGQVAASHEPLLLHPGEPLPRGAEMPGERAPALLAAALSDQHEGGVDGAIVVSAGDHRRFTAGEGKLLSTTATQLGVALRNRRMLESIREAERAQQELNIAASIQHGLLPREQPQFPAGEVAGRCVPAASVGGDYYDFLVDADGRLAFVIADVAGHSVSSALMMALARGVLRREMAVGSNPADVLAATNAVLHDDLEGAGLFITIFCGRLDPRASVLEYANAGQTRPMLRRADGAVEDLDADGLPAGFLRDVEYELGRTAFSLDDTLLLVTDGIVEARDPSGEMFGEQRLRSLVADNEAPAAEFIDEALAVVAAWMGDRAQQDDITLVAIVGRARSAHPPDKSRRPPARV